MSFEISKFGQVLKPSSLELRRLGIHPDKEFPPGTPSPSIAGRTASSITSSETLYRSPKRHSHLVVKSRLKDPLAMTDAPDPS
jgi:hypothetical protein